jgi:hypothetical protein
VFLRDPLQIGISAFLSVLSFLISPIATIS